MPIQSVNRPPIRWIMLIATLILLLGTIAIWSQNRRVYTVSDALARRTELNGQRITVRGYSLFVYEQTLQLCQPSRCDCNQSGSNYFLLVDEDTLVELDSAREKIDGMWRLITTGDFTIQLQQP